MKLDAASHTKKQRSTDSLNFLGLVDLLQEFLLWICPGYLQDANRPDSERM